MNRIEQIKVEQKKLADELEGEMIKERVTVNGFNRVEWI